MSGQAFINIPQWDGRPRECGTVWELRKGRRLAVCHLWTHPSGGEARLTVDGDWHRGEAGRDALALVELRSVGKNNFGGKVGRLVVTRPTVFVMGAGAEPALRVPFRTATAQGSPAVDPEAGLFWEALRDRLPRR